MKAPYTILAEVPEQFQSIVGDADGKVYVFADDFIRGLPSGMLKSAYIAQPGILTVRVPILPPIAAKLDPWTNLQPFAPLFEYEDIQIGIFDFEGRFGLPCGFGKRSGVWAVSGKLERWDQN